MAFYTCSNVIENEAAYNAAIRRNIIMNARKTFERNHADHMDIYAFLETGRIEDGHGRLAYKEGFVGSLAFAIDTYGKLSPKQVEAVRSSIEKMNARKAEWADKKAALDANRQFIGEVGKKITVKVTVKAVIAIDSFYGTSYINIMEDDAQNVIIYKGTSNNLPAKGDTGTITATVKEHGVRDGVKQTIVQRPKIVEGV